MTRKRWHRLLHRCRRRRGVFLFNSTDGLTHKRSYIQCIQHHINHQLIPPVMPTEIHPTHTPVLCFFQLPSATPNIHTNNIYVYIMRQRYNLSNYRFFYFLHIIIFYLLVKRWHTLFLALIGQFHVKVTNFWNLIR